MQKALRVVPVTAAGAAGGGGAAAGGGDEGAEPAAAALGAASTPAGTSTFRQSSPSSTISAISVPTVTSAELSGF